MTDAERKEDDGLQIEWSKLRTEYYLSLIKRQGPMSAEDITSLLEGSRCAIQNLKNTLQPAQSRLTTLDRQLYGSHSKPKDRDALHLEFVSLDKLVTCLDNRLNRYRAKYSSSWNSMLKELSDLASSTQGRPSDPTVSSLHDVWDLDRAMVEHHQKWGRLCTCPRPPSWNPGDPYTPVSSIQTDAQGAPLTKDPNALPVNATQV